MIKEVDLDLGGTVYLSHELIPGVEDLLNGLRKSGYELGYLSFSVSLVSNFCNKTDMKKCRA
jgi:phosphoglycolate phosphatase-like HAD superfamily hydrolase